MAYFGSSSFPANSAGTPVASNYSGGGTVKGTPTPTVNHGVLTTGTPSLQRNIIQFMNGAGIVDYGSLTMDTNSVVSHSPGGQIHMIDTRAGTNAGTSGFTPPVSGTETWTATFRSDAGVNGFAITSTAGVSTTCTVTTTLAHGYTNGDTVRITNTGDPLLDDLEFVIANVAASTFEVTTAGTAPGTGVAGEVGKVGVIAEVFDLKNSVTYAASGNEGSFSLDTNSKIQDRIGMYVSQGGAGFEWFIGDRFSFNVLVNPNTTDLWEDPDPEWGDFQAAGLVDRENASLKNATSPNLNDTSSLNGNTRVLISDPVGSGNAGDKIYLEIGYFEDHSAVEYGLSFRGLTGYSPPVTGPLPGNHPGATDFVFVNLDLDRMVYHLVCDKYAFRGVFQTATNRFHGCYAGFFDTYATRQEHAYPMLIIGEGNRCWPETTIVASSLSGGMLAGNYADSSGTAWTYNLSKIPSKMRILSPSSTDISYLGIPCCLFPLWNRNAYAGVAGDERFASIAVSPSLVISEIPVLPVLVCDQLGPSGTTVTIQDNRWSTTSTFGELRGVFACTANEPNEGDFITVGGVDYILIGPINTLPSSMGSVLCAIKLA